MGDRGNIYLKQNGGGSPGIYLYTHWYGSDLPATLQEALKRGQPRWADEQYFGRIIFSELTRGHEIELTGFGITTYPCDNDGRRPLLVVDSSMATVHVQPFPFDPSATPTAGTTFAEYILFAAPQLRAFVGDDY